jgi:hypothetical protein
LPEISADDAINPEAAQGLSPLTPADEYPHRGVVADDDWPDVPVRLTVLVIAINERDLRPNRTQPRARATSMPSGGVFQPGGVRALASSMSGRKVSGMVAVVLAMRSRAARASNRSP